MRARLFVLALALVVLTAACAPPATPPASPTPPPAVASPRPATAVAPAPATPTSARSAFPLTVTDDAGRVVTLARAPERLVSIAPSNTEILFALGLGPKVVAVDQYSTHPPEARQKAQLGSYATPDLEQIVAATPDLVLATGVHTKSIIGELEARRLPVLVLEPKDLDGVLTSITLVGRATGQVAQAAELVGTLRTRVEAVAGRVAGAPRSRVYVELSPQLHSAGPGSFVNDLLARAGGENVAADAATQWPQLSQEVVLQRNPEVILLAHNAGGDATAAVRARPGWETVSAVKGGRIVAIDPDLTTRPGPRAVDGLEALARALHPDRVR